MENIHINKIKIKRINEPVIVTRVIRASGASALSALQLRDLKFTSSLFLVGLYLQYEIKFHSSLCRDHWSVSGCRVRSLRGCEILKGLWRSTQTPFPLPHQPDLDQS